MGKIKTVVMGDLESEEKARKKAEEKREQKKRAKTNKDELSVLSSPLSDKSLPVISEPVSETEKPKTDKPKSENRKPKTDNKYSFTPGKKYAAAKSLVDPKKLYSISEAIDLTKKTSYSKFDGSVEVQINIDRQNLPAGRQDLRGMVTLPHGNGKKIKVVIATDELIKQLENPPAGGPKIDFDILVASPDMMPKLAKVAKILGPRGLMPNPKTGTIGDDPEKLAKELSGEQMQWKTQPDFPIVHTVIGKVSFEPKKLEENFLALTKSIGKDKIRGAFLKATMGPSIKVEF